MVVISCLASTTYFISDCQLFGRFAWETLLPRTIILIPMAVFIFLYRKIKDYRKMVVAMYTILHLIMWNTIWAIVYLPDKTHASEGFIIMHLMFFAIGFCAPFRYSTIAHSLLIADILTSHLFNQYLNLDLMLSLGIPCLLGIVASHYFMEGIYRDHYETTEKLKQFTLYDALTGVYNRNIVRHITEKDGKGFLSTMNRPISVVIFDIDHFKRVNDTYGHLQGDAVLLSLSEVVEGLLKEEDYLIRWGGEEFVLVLPGYPIDAACELAETIRRRVEDSDNGICRITISMGVAAYDGRDYKAAIDNADRALYHAKKNGRNCVYLYKNTHEYTAIKE